MADSLMDLLEKLAKLRLRQLNPAVGAEEKDRLEKVAAPLWEELVRRTPPPPKAISRSPLDAARAVADVSRFSVPPSHRRGAVGMLVTAGKSITLKALEPAARELLRAQNAYNQAAVEIAAKLVEDPSSLASTAIVERLSPLRDPRPKGGNLQRVQPLLDGVFARQQAWNTRLMELLGIAASGKLPEVKEANALIATLAKLCDPLGDLTGLTSKLASPLLREIFRRQNAFNTELMLVAADLLHGRPPVIGPQAVDYVTWIDTIEPGHIAEAQRGLRTLKRRPKFSLVVPAWETPEKILVACIESVRAQLYDNWELCLVDDASKSRRVAKIAERYARKDPRIRFKRLASNQGVALATNAAIELATGDYVAFMDHDDTLAPHALAEVALRFDRDPDLDWTYSDEDRLSEYGERHGPFFKPDFSPDLLRSVNYICHFVVVRANLARELKLRTGFDGAQDFDFLLRLSERSQRVAHIPRILYHWRLWDSMSRDETKIGAISKRGVKAVQEHLARLGEQGEVTDPVLTEYRIRYPVRGEPLVSIIIPFKDRVELLQRLIPSLLEKTRYQRYELLLVSNNSKAEETYAYLDSLNDPRIRKLRWDRPFNYPAVNNFAVKEARGELLLFLNNDMEVVDPLWLEELIGHAQRPEVGAVGCRLHFPDGSLQHAGVVVGLNGYAAHPFWRFPTERFHTPFGNADWTRNYLAVTSACVMLRRQEFEKLQGYDERFAVCGSDVDLGLRLIASGKRVVYTSATWLYHHESASRRNVKIPEVDYWQSILAYRPWLEGGDPFYNPNLTLRSTDCSLRLDQADAVELAAQAVIAMRAESQVTPQASRPG